MQVKQFPIEAALIALALVTASCGATPVVPTLTDPSLPIEQAQTPEPLPAGERLPADVHPLGYAVDLIIIPGEPRFGGTVAIHLRLDRARHVIWLNAEDLHVTAVSVDGQPATWSTASAAQAGLASVTLADGKAIPAGEATLSVTYDAAVSHGGDSVFDVAEDGRHYTLTTFEPISARKALPCFDEPGFKVPFDLTLTVPFGDGAFSNTPEVDSTPLDGGRKRVRFERSKPLPTYLFSFAVGPFDVILADKLPTNDNRLSPLPIRGIALAGKGQRIKDQLAQVGPLVTALEAWFGTPYPYTKLDVVALPSFPGAMENAALILFDEYLLMVDTKRAPLDEQRGATNTLAHELSHQWFGNLVTMQWWDDLWLNEAFATWIANHMVAVVRPELGGETRRLQEWRKAMESDSKASVRKIRQPIESQHDMFSAFDAITYSKGASIIAMFESWVGAEAWRTGVRAYLKAHAFGNATTDDLLREVSRVSGRDIGPAFRSFLDNPGAPVVTLTVGAAANGKVPIFFDLQRWLPIGSTAKSEGRWQVPVCLAALAPDKKDDTETCVLVTEPHQELELAFGGKSVQALIPNALGIGYYQAVVQPESLLRAALAQPRSAAEAANLVASYQAGFLSGALSAEAVLDALALLAASEEPELVRAALRIFDRIGDAFLALPADGTARIAFQQRMRKLFSDQLTRLGWAPKKADEGTEVRLLRGKVLTFLARTARDPRVRRDAARKGQEVIGNGTIKREVVTPELLGMVLAVAVEDGTPAFFDKVMATLHATREPSLRKEVMVALAATHDPKLAAQVHALALDPRVTETEALMPLGARLADASARAETFAWFEANFDQILARVPPFEAGYLPALAGGFCDATSRAEVERFFTPRVEAMPGAPRTLAETLESIDLCRALVDKQGDGVRRWLGITGR